MHIKLHSSFIRTVPSASELHRICQKACGLYRRWGISPRPEDNFIIVLSIYIVKHYFLRESLISRKSNTSSVGSAGASSFAGSSFFLIKRFMVLMTIKITNETNRKFTTH